MSRPALVLALALVLSHDAAAAGPPARYDAQIRRTSHGVAHIRASDFGSLGFGEGFAQAEDHLCTVADQVVKARGERSKYFGAGKGDEHLRSDIALRAMRIHERGLEMLVRQSREIRDWYEGYASGYNAYLGKTGKANLPAWCRGQDWVFPITAQDLAAYQQVFLLVTTSFAPGIATAAPPGSATAPAAPGAVSEADLDLASNGWAIGKDLSATGRGMLLANPHYPWVGSNRFWEKHLTIPGKLDVYGVGLIGSIGVAIGFNQDVAWTHTVSAGKRFTLYSLDLVPGRPTTYKYDQQEREMTKRPVTVAVKQPDGSLRNVARDVWFSHYGPIVNTQGLAWTTSHAYAVRDANLDNWAGPAQWLDMGRARSMKELQKAHEKHQGMPWVNTIATSREGIAWYADSASTPNLSREAISLWEARRKSDPETRRLNGQGAVLLDGSDSRFEWQNDPSSNKPGVVGYLNTPRLERRDYVFNANDSFWLANSRAPIEGPYSPLHGEQKVVRSLRTRNNDLTLSDRSPDRPSNGDGRFTLDELGDAILSNRSLAAELLKDELADRCVKQPSVTVDGAARDLGTACQVLKSWNGRFDLDSRGAVLFREWLSQYHQADFQGKGRLYAEDFDPRDPVNTPRTLAPAGQGGDLSLEQLARAANVLMSRSISLDAPLGELQYADKAGRRMPVHGGDGFIDGLMNMQRNSRNTTTLEPMDEPKLVKGSRTLTEKGYPVVHGTSFIMVLEYTKQGPRAKAFLTYSQSGDPASPLFTDQTELFARKAWRTVRFDEKAIAADVKRNYRVGNQ
jgi:acyl-homoserine-lactone acylase